MMNNRRIWQFPWQYKESIIFLAGVIIVGYFLQIEAGAFDFSIFAYPANAVVAIGLILLCGIGAFARNNPVIAWLSGVPFAVTLLFAFLVLGIIMGLTPQGASPTLGNWLSIIGFTQMTASWPFVFVYVLTLLSLGLLIGRRLRTFKPFKLAFHLNHIGLWVLLAAAGLGHADMRRFVMYPELKQDPQWRVFSPSGDALELPIAIGLNNFTMETYPAKISIIDSNVGTPQPESNPIFFQLESGASQVKIQNWEIQIESYIHQAAPGANKSYRHWPVVGSTAAASITARNILTKEERRGWISSGSIAQPYAALTLDDKYSLVMLQPEAKHYLSDITIYMQDQEPMQAQLTVNNPIKMGNWMIYQYGYDEDAGDMSIYSAVELVYDPWLNYVYAGFALLALGALGMIWTGRKKSDVIA